MIDVITGRDINSVWGSFILNNLTDGEYSFTNDWGIDLKTIEASVAGGTSYGVILLGKPIEENQVASLDNTLESMASMPFNIVGHFANWGETLSIPISEVDEKVNYVTKLVDIIGSGQEIVKFKDEPSKEFAKGIAEGLQSHQQYDGGMLGKSLMLLAELYQVDIINKDYKSIEDIGNTEEVVLRSLRRNMKDYVNRKIEEADMQITNKGTIVVSLFADRYDNELGQLFIKSLAKDGRKVIILMGKQTRGDDIYHIRTSEGISAKEVAQTLNNGQGKDRAATVFLPKGNQSVYNTINTTLNSADI